MISEAHEPSDVCRPMIFTLPHVLCPSLDFAGLRFLAKRTEKALERRRTRNLELWCEAYER